MKYTFDCPGKDCDHVDTVEAANDDEAVEKLMEAGAAHGKEVHPDMKMEGMEEMVRKGMKKEE